MASHAILELILKVWSHLVIIGQLYVLIIQTLKVISSTNTEIYQHEMPGGQYSNLSQQAKGSGLGERFDEVKDMYRRVNFLFGDIVKVTPSSKVVGDMALYMVQNDLDEQSVITDGVIRFPRISSVVLQR